MAAQINRILDMIDQETKDIVIVERAAAAVGGARRAYVVLGASALAFAFLFLGFGAPFISHLVGCVFPVYASLKAIEAASSDEATQWLMYWVIYAAFSLVESVGDRLLFWFPMYFAAKIAFLLYCQLPFFRGARFLYLTFVGPWFAAHRAELDAQVARLGGAATVFTEAIQTIATPIQTAAAAAAAASKAAAPEASLDDIFATSGPLRQRSAGGADARR